MNPCSPQSRALWCSPALSPLTGIVSDEQHELVITADSTGLIRTWRGHTGQNVASFSTGSPRCTLLQYNTDGGWFLTVGELPVLGVGDVSCRELVACPQVGTSLGSLCTLAGSSLTKTSSVVVCDSFDVNMLLVSPDKKWVMAGTKDNNDSSPQVFLVCVSGPCVVFHRCETLALSFQLIWTESLTRAPQDEDEALRRPLPVAGSQAAVFVPGHPARLAVLHSGNKALTVFDVGLRRAKSRPEVQGEDGRLHQP